MSNAGFNPEEFGCGQKNVCLNFHRISPIEEIIRIAQEGDEMMQNNGNILV